MTAATGYDGLSSRLVSAAELRAFLLKCFDIGEHELFVSQDDAVNQALRDVSPDVVFAAFCTYRPAFGHFAMSFDIGIEGRLADRVGRQEFIERFAAHFDAYVLYGDTEPEGQWTVILPNGSRLRATMDSDEDRYFLETATAPIPGVPDLRVSEHLWSTGSAHPQDGETTVGRIEPSASHDVPSAAVADQKSVIELTRELIAVPSRAGTDSYEPVLARLTSWLTRHDLSPTPLKDETGATVGLTCEVTGAFPGPRWVLNACLDTAAFGDESVWAHPPTSAVVEDGWLYGRGGADSKAGAAIFCHIAARLATITDRLRGKLVLLFDVDEHTGRFGGAKRYFEGPDAPDDVAGVMIGYPGFAKLVVGGRGVYRAKLSVHGVASHSGGGETTPNAIEKAAQLIRTLAGAELPSGTTTEFPLAGKLTVTGISGGEGYSVTPDLCTLNVDIRTTPTFDEAAAARLLAGLTAHVDEGWPGTRPTSIRVDARWPAYVLDHDSRLRTAITEAAKAAGVEVEAKVAGPSNIGNYLAGLGIPATAGFGVDYVSLHGTDERIRLDTIPTVQAIYHTAALNLLGVS